MAANLPKLGLVSRAPRGRKLVLKATFRRTQLLQFLQDSERRHLNADEIFRLLFEKGIHITLATIYRVLSDLEEAGLVKRQIFQEGKAVFEINDGHPHGHIVCIHCGRIDEFHDTQLKQVQREIAQSLDYSLKDCSLALYGACSSCK